MTVPVTNTIGSAISMVCTTVNASLTVITTTCSAANKLASAADRLAGWCDETAATFEEEAQFNRQLRREELQRKIAEHRAQASAAPTAP